VEFRHTFGSSLDAAGSAVTVQQKMMHVMTAINMCGEGMMDSKLEPHRKLLKYDGVGSVARLVS
jgi:hypothetical protein